MEDAYDEEIKDGTPAPKVAVGKNVRVIKIRELDIHSIGPRTGASDEDGLKLVFIGKPGSGKSVLMKYVLYMKKHIFPVGCVVSGTEDSNKFFASMFPKTMIHESLDVQIVNKFIKRQKLAKELIKDDPWAVLITDDCMDDPSMFRKTTFFSLFKNGRHWKLLYMLGMQYAMDVPPAIRTCIDGTFIFRDPNPRNRKILYENYAGILPTYDLFCAIMDQLTDDYTAIFINNKTTSNDFQDCVFFIKAEQIGDFEFGCEDYWLYDEARRKE